MQSCPTCSTPLDADGACVTCAAAAEGLVLINRSDYSNVRESMLQLQTGGLRPQMERVPSGGEHEDRQPRFNLYIPREEVEQAGKLMGQDWQGLLEDEGAIEAARRGARGVDLDAGGEIICPACGHTFTLEGEAAECPECGLGLGAPG